MCIFIVPGQIRKCVKWDVTGKYLVLTPYHHALCPGASHLQFPHLNMGTQLQEFFQRITSHEYKKFAHLWSMVSIFHQNVLLQKTCIPTFLHPSKKACLSNHDHFCYEIHQNTEWQMSFCPAEASAGRAGNFLYTSPCQYCLNMPLFQCPRCNQSEHTGGSSSMHFSSTA